MLVQVGFEGMLSGKGIEGRREARSQLEMSFSLIDLVITRNTEFLK